MKISIHALREEGDLAAFNAGALHFNFYPRPPRGGRLQQEDGQTAEIIISIHALREEGDLQTEVDKLTAELFLSTPSARRATYDFDYN